MTLTNKQYNFLSEAARLSNLLTDRLRGKNGWAVIDKPNQNFNDVICEQVFGRSTITNEERSRLEVYTFIRNPLKKGEKYTAYLSSDEKFVTTWMGDQLGRVTELGKRLIVIKGIDGRTYRGLHNGPGMYLHFRCS